MPWRRSPGVVFEVIDGRAVLVDGRGAELITLNRVGTLVWEQLEGDRDTDDLVGALAARFHDVARQQIDADVRGFLAELEDGSLITRVDGPSG